MSKKNKTKIDSSDLNRVVLTETIPYEVPIIFSNEGLYKNLKRKSGFIYDLLFKDCYSKFTIPLNYKIRKHKYYLRNMSLIHPVSQNKVVSFYNEYKNIICHYTQKSESSLRYPKKVGSAYYKKNIDSNKNKYKLKNTIEHEKYDKITRHPVSYFAYGGYRKLHEFYDSEEIIKYEKKYQYLMLLDISKCFPSIYTHTISWAVRNKELSKEFSQKNASFGSEFDTLMQELNYNETNGIIIGPEISRIFSEIILQDIDAKIIKRLASGKIIYNRDYTLKRYVDDYFVFAVNKDIISKIQEEIIDQLLLYNLHINDKKIEYFTRPFYTKKSKIVKEVSIEINNFISRFIERKENYIEDIKVYESKPKRIYKYLKLKKSFIDSIKVKCDLVEDGFILASKYIIASLLNRIVNLTDNSSIISDENEMRNYKTTFSLLLDCMFYFYCIEPSVNASYKLGQAIVIVSRFFEKNINSYEKTIKQYIMELAINLLQNPFFINSVERQKFVPLEKLNVILAIGDLGEDYLLTNEFVKKIYDLESNELTYFEIMSILFYIKNYTKYSEIKDLVKNFIRDSLNSLEEVKKKAECAYILLDTLTCPYLDTDFKVEIMHNLLKEKTSTQMSKARIKVKLKDIEKDEWFINWKDIDLLNNFEKKEFMSSY